MKKVEAIIHPFELIDVREALNHLGIEEITVSDVMGVKPFENNKKIRRRGEYAADFISKIKIEIAAESDKAEAVREAIEKAINTNDMTGLIFSPCEFYNESENPDMEEEENMDHITEKSTLAALSSKRRALPIKGGQDDFEPRKKYGMQRDLTLKGIQGSLALRKKDNDKTGFIWKVTKTSDPDIRAITVISKNRPGIFSKLAGVFTLNGLDIVHARSYRQGENTLDIFKVRAFPGHIMDEAAFDRAENDLKTVLAGHLDLSDEFRKKIASYSRLNRHKTFFTPPQVTVNNDDSLLFSIIEVSADDFPGLLFRITDAIFRCGLKVWMSKISTKGDRVTDTFYVKDAAENKAESPLQVANIRAVILDAITGGGN